MGKAINLRLADDDHRRLKVLAAESGVTFAKVIGLALQALEQVLPPPKVEVEPPPEADPRQRVLPGVTFTVQHPGAVDVIHASTTLPEGVLEFTPDEQAALDRGESIQLTVPDDADQEPAPEPDAPGPVALTDSSPAGQPEGAVAASDDDDWWRDL